MSDTTSVKATLVADASDRLEILIQHFPGVLVEKLLVIQVGNQELSEVFRDQNGLDMRGLDYALTPLDDWSFAG